jgi:type II secretory ATPase GspE/PulE/Tfp pilus assembly ATPase PilB-like protein
VTEQDFQVYAARLLGQDAVVTNEIAPFESLNYTSQSGEAGPLTEPGGNDLLARILTEAIRRKASDVHLEPRSQHAAARLRIDGRMAACTVELNRGELRSLVSQVKVMSNIDITRGFLPQDGNFSLRADGQELEIRVSTIPCHGGEKAVLRLVLPNPEFGWLENLVLSAPLCQLATDVFHSSHGLVLVTGPTGSGKTTTLYAALNSIWRRDSSINVVTIEDPIEYNLPFATQTQINRAAGLQFTSVMRALLRQDPDVILVGEIRDEESAAMALDAATTGHLVLSSLHTHSAMETLARLRQLNVKPYLLADALQGVISQRLVPRQRPELCEKIPEDDASVKHLQHIGVLGEHGPCVLRRPPKPSDESSNEEIASGRIAVFEMLALTPSLRNLIECDAPVATMEDRMEPNSFIGMKDYCRFLLEKGLISPESAATLFSRFEGPAKRWKQAGQLTAT